MRISGVFSIALLSISFTVAGAEIPADKDIIVFQGELGDVTFNHKLHSGLENVGGVEKVECSTCHHTYEGEGDVKACSNCHVRGKKQASTEALDLKKAFHFRCRECHKYTMEQGKHAGPDRKCTLCHIR